MISVKLVSKELLAIPHVVINYYRTTWVITNEEGEVSRVAWDTRQPCQNPLIRKEWRRLEDVRIYAENQVILERLAATVYNQDYQYRNRCLRGW